MRKFLCAALSCAAIIVSGSAIADDSSAALGAGGLQFTKAADIRMAREDLFISPNAVRIRYEFANDGKTDVDSIVAFPLPDIDSWQFAESPIGTVSDTDPVNFVGFTATIDGKRVPVQVEQRAMLNGKDVTALVKSVGLPVNITLAGNYDKLQKLSPAKKQVLKKAGLAEGDDSETFPKWTVQTRFYWTQHFPAGKTIVIEHSYKPVTGQTFFTQNDLTEKPGDDGSHWVRDYCMDGPALSAIRAKMAVPKPGQDADQGLLNIYSTDFVLKTANNWKGGIGVLHLTVDKLKPGNILSMCWDGNLKKTGPTTFESTLNNVQPARDIKLVVLE